MQSALWIGSSAAACAMLSSDVDALWMQGAIAVDESAVSAGRWKVTDASKRFERDKAMQGSVPFEKTNRLRHALIGSPSPRSGAE